MTCRHLLIAFAVVAVLPGVRPLRVAAQDTTRVQVSAEGVTFDFQDVDLRAVIAALAEVAGLNIVYGSLPSRPVTLRTTRPVPASQARDLLVSVARANGLELLEEGAVTRIVTASTQPAQVEPARPTRGAQERRLYVHRLRHARAEVLVRTLRQIFGLEPMAFETSGSTGRSLSQQLREQRSVPYVQGPQTQPRAPDEGPAAAPAQAGVLLGLESAVDLVPDVVNNAVLALATPGDYAVVQAAIDQLDTRPLQVLIEVVIAEFLRDKTTDVGVSVSVPLPEGQESGVTFELEGLSGGDLALGVLGIGDAKADVVLRTLAKKGSVNILSRPILLATNNQEARILVGDQRPFVQLFRSLPTDDAVRDQIVQYRDVGTRLLIRPTINADGYVTLSILQEVSTATSEEQFGAPVIKTREAETELMLRDGQTAVLGGLIAELVESSNSGIPLLKDIPVLGLLFGTTHHRKVVQEILLLVTPRVIESDEEADRVRQQIEGAMPNVQQRVSPMRVEPDSVRP